MRATQGDHRLLRGGNEYSSYPVAGDVPPVIIAPRGIATSELHVLMVTVFVIIAPSRIWQETAGIRNQE